MLNIVLFGAPGSGKGTQGKKIADKYNLLHVSFGDLLRQNIENKTDIGKEISKYVDNGKLVPTYLMIEIVEKQLLMSKKMKGIVLDGFPRSIEQAKVLEEKMKNQHIQISVAILLEVEQEALLARINSRAKIDGRSDDQSEEKIATRMKIYNYRTLPMANYYADTDKLYKVNGMGEVDLVFNRICSTIKPLIS